MLGLGLFLVSGGRIQTSMPGHKLLNKGVSWP